MSQSQSQSQSPIILSLDGNIGAGKTTLLAEIRKHFHHVHIVDEPVGQWTSLKDETGKSMLELFYEDKKRWAYTFQSCAIMTRFKNIQDAVMNLDPTVKGPQVIITERSILTDKHIFAEMLRDSGDMNLMEWDLYEGWFNIFSKRYPVNGIIYVSTSSSTSKERIGIRNRQGEDKIEMSYLEQLDEQHKKWISETNLPVLTLSTETDVSLEENLEKIKNFIQYIMDH